MKIYSATFGLLFEVLSIQLLYSRLETHVLKEETKITRWNDGEVKELYLVLLYVKNSHKKWHRAPQ